MFLLSIQSEIQQSDPEIEMEDCAGPDENRTLWVKFCKVSPQRPVQTSLALTILDHSDEKWLVGSRDPVCDLDSLPRGEAWPVSGI